MHTKTRTHQLCPLFCDLWPSLRPPPRTPHRVQRVKLTQGFEVMDGVWLFFLCLIPSGRREAGHQRLDGELHQHHAEDERESTLPPLDTWTCAPARLCNALPLFPFSATTRSVAVRETIR